MQRLSNIQILRGVAALMIVVHHCGVETARLAAAAGRDPLFDENPWGWGISLFFVISGFIMVVTSGDAFGQPGAAADFMRRRLIRIVPLYWAVTTVALGAALVLPNLMKMPSGDVMYAIGSYLFWPMMRADGNIRPLATPGWTLNLEMMFYAVFAFALLFRRRTGLLILFGALGLLIAARVSGLAQGVALSFWGDPIIVNFMLGVLIGVAYQNGMRVSRTTALTLAACGFTMVFFPIVPEGAPDDFWPRVLDAIPSVLVLFGLALGPQADENSRAWQQALLIGDASYSLYLTHEFLLRPLYLVWKKSLLETVPLWTFIPLGIAISVAAALLTYRYFERPTTVWLNRLTKPGRKRWLAAQPRQSSAVTAP